MNTASRLETTSEPGAIHVSSAVADRLREAFVIEPRGPIELKGKGVMATSYLRGRRRS